MQVSCIAVVLLAVFVAMATSFKLPGSERLGKPKDPSKLAAVADNLVNYEVVAKRVELHPQYLGNYLSEESNVRVEMYNETMPVISGSVVLLKDLPANMMIRVSGHRYSESNQWIMVFDHGWINYCKFAENNVSFMQNVLKSVNVTDCPYGKGTYTVTNFVTDEKEFPPGIPESTFRIDSLFAGDGKTGGGMSFYVEVIHRDDYDDDE